MVPHLESGKKSLGQQEITRGRERERERKRENKSKEQMQQHFMFPLSSKREKQKSLAVLQTQQSAIILFCPFPYFCPWGSYQFAADEEEKISFKIATTGVQRQLDLCIELARSGWCCISPVYGSMLRRFRLNGVCTFTADSIVLI